MIAPHFNSRATVIVYVADGTGSFEMSCPHLSTQGQEYQDRREQEEEESGGQYHRVTARLSRGDTLLSRQVIQLLSLPLKMRTCA